MKNLLLIWLKLVISNDQNFICQNRKSKTELSSPNTRSMTVLHREKMQTPVPNKIILWKDKCKIIISPAMAATTVKF